MFTGLSAFPLTPFKQEQVDVTAFAGLISNLVSANVDSICAMGSTGLYPYLSREQLFNVSREAVAIAANIPVMVGVGALRTYDVLLNIETVQKAGVSAVLLAPVAYHPLSEEEVFSLYETVSSELSVPMCVYENPRVTQFTFSDSLYQRIATLPNIGAVKIPGLPFASAAGAQRLSTLRAILPKHIAIGVSGDKFGSAGMAAGCDLWLSVLAGLFPRTVQTLIALSQDNTIHEATHMNAELNGIWQLFDRNNGGLRVMASAATLLGYCEANCLPKPLLSLNAEDTAQLSILIDKLN